MGGVLYSFIRNSGLINRGISYGEGRYRIAKNHPAQANRADGPPARGGGPLLLHRTYGRRHLEKTFAVRRKTRPIPEKGAPPAPSITRGGAG